MYLPLLNQMKKMLGQMDAWLTATEAYAASKKIEPAVFLELRLAPDQFAFVRQVRTACDTAKLATARLAGRDAPKHDDTETTFEQLHARVQSVIAYLDGFTADDVAAAATRVITQPRWEGKTMTGASYFVEHAVPNFFFHVTTAYAILRHNGVPLGKRDYLGPLTMTSA